MRFLGNVIDKIMDFHGDIDKMLPEGYFPKSKKLFENK